MPHANGRKRPGALCSTVKGSGRRQNQRKPMYNLQRGFAKIEGTIRKCFRHPSREAILFEKNTQDGSYKRPMCEECAK